MEWGLLLWGIGWGYFFAPSPKRWLWSLLAGALAYLLREKLSCALVLVALTLESWRDWREQETSILALALLLISLLIVGYSKLGGLTLCAALALASLFGLLSCYGLVGDGDVPVVAAIVLGLGWWQGSLALMLGIELGGLLALIAWLSGRTKIGDQWPLIPFLTAGCWLSLPLVVWLAI